MSEKEKKRLDFQKKMIARQSEEIEELKTQIKELKLELEKKDEIINSVSSLRNELAQNVLEVKKYKEEYRGQVEELRRMKKIIDVTVYKGKWRLVKLLIK